MTQENNKIFMYHSNLPSRKEGDGTGLIDLFFGETVLIPVVKQRKIAPQSDVLQPEDEEVREQMIYQFFLEAESLLSEGERAILLVFNGISKALDPQKNPFSDSNYQVAFNAAIHTPQITKVLREYFRREGIGENTFSSRDAQNGLAIFSTIAEYQREQRKSRNSFGDFLP